MQESVKSMKATELEGLLRVHKQEIERLRNELSNEKMRKITVEVGTPYSKKR